MAALSRLPNRRRPLLAARRRMAPSTQSITPLQEAELQPRDRLLVVTCAYQLADRTEASDDMEDRFVLAADSVGFHLITALFSQETATS